MYESSRTSIYDYLYGLFFGVVTNNVYSIQTPLELTKSDVEDGFIVLHVGDMYDQSEFTCNAYGQVRCYVEAFVPPISRGRLNFDKYETFESLINEVIAMSTHSVGGSYAVQEDSVISMDGYEIGNADNQFFVFVKSFIVNIQ